MNLEYAAGNTASFAYDAAGRISRFEDKSGTTTYERDALGRILSKMQIVNDNPPNPSRFRAEYGYSNGALTSISYPSGLKIFYRRSVGRIIGIDVQPPSGTNSSFVGGLAYSALEQPKSWNWSNGDFAHRTFDADGRMVSNEFASYQYDTASRVTGITQKLWAHKAGQAPMLHQVPITWSVEYDNRDRLTSFVREGAATRYSYNANSNRLSSVESISSESDLDGALDGDNRAKTISQALNVDSASNKLTGLEQVATQMVNDRTQSESSVRVPYRLDANGALISDGLRIFEYDESRRLSKVKLIKGGEDAFVSYMHNALGQRVFKSEVQWEQFESRAEDVGEGFINWLKSNFGWLLGGTRAQSALGQAFVYGDGAIPPWALLGEYDNGSAQGKGRTEYIWLPTQAGQAIPIGLYKNGSFYAVHSDHLGTPRLVTDAQNTPLWQWPYSAFGNNAPTQPLKTVAAGSRASLKGAKPEIELNLRFPGQYFDEESNLAYNYFRSYLPGHGRYTQADPIGLAGGLNVFTYVEGNPPWATDTMGLLSLNDLFPTTPTACKKIILDPEESKKCRDPDYCYKKAKQELAKCQLISNPGEKLICIKCFETMASSCM